MEQRRWMNQSQPQTLQIAVFLLYINAFFTAFYGGLGSLIGLLLIVANVGAGYGVANEKRWAYGLALAVAFLPFVLRLLLNGLDDVLGTNLINLMFEIALVALLLHPQSREYQRIWFK
ncbi:MAG TPA: hypothetical protein VHF47_11100 [Acidimicrobiales bacterium]|nr:hypothetical protein [Acidimicrobiales bacterium]